MPRAKSIPLEVCILAGGRSARMGRDKARVRIRGVTMLARVRESAGQAFKLRCRVIRKDLVPRCGPLGGILTALHTSRARAVLFLACDMPLVSPALLRRLARTAQRDDRAAFVIQKGRVGFPCVIKVGSLPMVEEHAAAGSFSLQSLARKLRARRLLVPARSNELLNVNTPEDAIRAGALTRS